jgi:hypothetical protein
MISLYPMDAMLSFPVRRMHQNSVNTPSMSTIIAHTMKSSSTRYFISLILIIIK